MLMREKEENIVFFYDKKNDIKLNVFVWFVNFVNGRGLVNNNILSYKMMLLIVFVRYVYCYMIVISFFKIYVLYRLDVVYVVKVMVVWIF